MGDRHVTIPLSPSTPSPIIHSHFIYPAPFGDADARILNTLQQCGCMCTERYRVLRVTGECVNENATSSSFMSLRTKTGVHPVPSLPLVPGCSCYKSGSPAVSRCPGGHAGSGGGYLGAIAGKEGRKTTHRGKDFMPSSVMEKGR